MCVHKHTDTLLLQFFQNINSEFCSVENSDLEQKHFSSFQTKNSNTGSQYSSYSKCHGKKSKKKIHKLLFKAGLEKHAANESQAMLRTKKIASNIQFSKH